jgi:orotate phosphoribosyltransferase
MKPYQRDFIDFCIKHNVIKFGTFTLKSGRISPYFINAGLFNTGSALSAIGRFYAEAILDSGISYDILFGPAYKGIPLVCSAALALNGIHGKDTPFAFNRKEKKEHGEGGNIVGTPLRGNILLIDDVITAGTAIRESIEIINAANAKLNGVLVLVDRQEVASDGSGLSAIQLIEAQYGIVIKAIVTTKLIVQYMEEKGEFVEHLQRMREYQMQFGTKEALSVN